MASMIGRAAKRFDQAFAALPIDAQKGIGLAIYRAFPAAAQYQKDLAPLLDSEEMSEAVWDLVVALAIRIGMRGKNFMSATVVAEMEAQAPTVSKFLAAVGRALDPAAPHLRLVGTDESVE